MFISILANAQIGGNGVYRFLYLQPNARIAALGGLSIATPDSNDINLLAQNPSLINSEMNNLLGLSVVNYLSGIQAGYVTFAHDFNKIGTVGFGLQYINYGEFNKRDNINIDLGTAYAGDYCFNATYGKYSGPWKYGATVKLIASQLETYSSYGIAADVAGSYYFSEQLIYLSAVISNFGTQIKPYYKGNVESVPYNVQFGVSKKFEHNPLRISFIANNLQDIGKMLYQIDNRNNKNINLETGLPLNEEFSAFEQVLSNLIVNTELVFSRNFMLRMGYNYARRWEMALSDTRGPMGFSWGFGIKISKFQVSYGSSSYHIHQNTNHFSLTTNLNDFKRKK